MVGDFWLCAGWCCDKKEQCLRFAKYKKCLDSDDVSDAYLYSALTMIPYNGGKCTNFIDIPQKTTKANNV